MRVIREAVEEIIKDWIETPESRRMIFTIFVQKYFDEFFDSLLGRGIPLRSLLEGPHAEDFLAVLTPEHHQSLAEKAKRYR